MRIPRPAAVLLLIAGVLLLLSCKNDSYESGDSRYSYLRADFCMMHTSDKGTIDYLLIDGGDTVRIATPVKLNWASKADSLYRALVYYDVTTRQMFSATSVLVTQPVSKQKAATLSTDAITVESTWEGGGYFNVAFNVKTGQTDEPERPAGILYRTRIPQHAAHQERPVSFTQPTMNLALPHLSIKHLLPYLCVFLWAIACYVFFQTT